MRRLGFDPPGTDLDAWLHLARIIEVDPSQITVAELYEKALAWVDRTRIREQFCQRLRRKEIGRRNLPASSTAPRESRENTGFGFVGHRDWENWGLGLDVNQGWHLYHFQRRDGQWRRHQHCALRIPGGLPGSLAQAFVTGRGELTEGVARSLWKRHARNQTPGSTVDKVKSALSRLRKAILEAIHKEGHRPEGNPFLWQPDQQAWRSLLKFEYQNPRCTPHRRYAAGGWWCSPESRAGASRSCVPCDPHEAVREVQRRIAGSNRQPAGKHAEWLQIGYKACRTPYRQV